VVTFTCAACGLPAGRVRPVPAGEPVDIGPGVGPQAVDSPGVVVSGFLGDGWYALRPADFARIRTLLDAASPDPLALRELRWEAAPFYCPECAACYCSTHWATEVIFDEGFYDCTMGVCPAGHRELLDD
jgi:hypothetical protein